MILNCLKEDRWLSEVIRRETFRLELEGAILSDKAWALELKKYLNQKIFVYSKSPVEKIAETQFLEGLGFKLVDTNISFALNNKAHGPNPSSTKIRPANKEDEAQVVEIALESFSYSRFHLDPRFTAIEAGRVKGEWVQNFFNGKRGHEMFVAEAAGIVVGFLLLINQGHGNWVIDLIGVKSAMKGKGVGPSMIDHALTHCRDLQTMDVGTQLANLPSIKMYERLGFRFSKAAYIFHYHGD